MEPNLQPTSFFEKLNDKISNSVSIKLASIGFLTLILLIPGSMIQSLIYERESLREQTIHEISAKWGYEQTLVGPVLNIPFKKALLNANGKPVISKEVMHILPDQLSISGHIKPEKRYRGIYEVVVYNSVLNFSGNFAGVTAEAMGLSDAEILWNEAFVSIGIPDMRGIKENIALSWNGTKNVLNPGISTKNISESGVSCRVAVLPENVTEPYKFSFSLNINGSKNLNFIPLGKETKVVLTSDWKNPSFDGAFLPEKREVTENGFSAEWKVLHLNRNYPQYWAGPLHNVYDSSFGVNLLLPVDQYQKSMRSAKYAIMFISLTFLIFFFVEILNRKRIHPFQYILVGLALTLFYTLLVSLSEHINFNLAYLISCIGVIGMITFYAASIFKNKLLTAILSLVLLVLYGFMFITLQMQDYALLIGSIGLFAVLATVMYLSRNINWYSIHKD
jgi:inner membrane protein